MDYEDQDEKVQKEEGVPEHCPNCLSKNIVPIAYGMPGPEMREAAARGEIELGGCVMSIPCAEWHCRDCKVDFDDEGKVYDRASEG